MKKIVSLFMIISIFCTFTIPIYAEDVNVDKLDLLTQNAVIMEAKTGKIVYAKNDTEQKAPASVTKIMTMLLVLEQIENKKLKFDDMITASEHAKEMGGTQINLDVGEKMSVYDLLMSVAVASANDSAMALAEHIGKSESGFVKMMNDKAKELGMNNTNFVNPHGLPVDNHVTCAKDIAIMTRELLKYEKAEEFISTKIYPIREGEKEYKMRNTNNLLWSYNGCIGGKTGYTQDAGYCMSVSAKRDGVTMIAVVMGEKTSKDRTADLEKMLDYAFMTYDLFEIDLKDIKQNNIPVKYGDKQTVKIEIENPQVPSQLIIKGSQPKVSQKVNIKKTLNAPVKNNDKVGDITIFMNDEIVYKTDIIAIQEIRKRTVFHSFMMIIKNIVSM